MASVMLDAKGISVFIRNLAPTGARARKAARKAARLEGEIPFDRVVVLLSEAIEDPAALIGALLKLSLTSGAVEVDRCGGLVAEALAHLFETRRNATGESSTKVW